MLAMFRRFLNTWAARAFFIVLIGSFGLWGVSGVIQDISTAPSFMCTVHLTNMMGSVEQAPAGGPADALP